MSYQAKSTNELSTGFFKALDSMRYSQLKSTETAARVGNMNYNFIEEVKEIKVGEEKQEEYVEIQIISIDEEEEKKHEDNEEKVEIGGHETETVDSLAGPGDGKGWTLVTNTRNKHNSKRNYKFVDNAAYHSYYYH